MSNKVKIPNAENLQVKNAFYVHTDEALIIYHYGTAIAVETKADRKLYLYANKLTQSDARAVREVYSSLERVNSGYEYYNLITKKMEKAGLISELQ